MFCGSNHGGRSEYAEAARELGAILADESITLVYGGGRVGLMGVVADAVLEAGGKAHGVIPQALVDKEVAHPDLTTLTTVTTMHERKAAFTEMSDAFVCLPGGIGTLDELFEAWTWNALGYHAKPFCLLDVHGFWRGLDLFLDHVAESGFLSPGRRAQLMLAHTPSQKCFVDTKSSLPAV